jgi:hypothetical protein
LSNLAVLASFSNSHMTNKQEYKQKKILEHLYQQYVKLDFAENGSFFGSFVHNCNKVWVASKKCLFITISINIFEVLLC